MLSFDMSKVWCRYSIYDSSWYYSERHYTFWHHIESCHFLIFKTHQVYYHHRKFFQLSYLYEARKWLVYRDVVDVGLLGSSCMKAHHPYSTQKMDRSFVFGPSDRLGDLLPPHWWIYFFAFILCFFFRIVHFLHHFQTLVL